MAVVEDVQVSDTVAVGAKPKVIDLYATWCGPCKMIAPILEELEKEYAGKVVFEKVDIDENRAIAEQYQVEAIPTLIFMKPDGTYEKKVGFMEKDAIKAEIAKLLE
ncbi:MAG: thioredoxin [Bacteroidales bacterium]|nr:thioredoxin [Bacteroidales bacterium]